MRMTSLVAISVFGATAGMASAQSLTAADWAGAYYGLSLGYANGDSSHSQGASATGGPGIDGGAFGVTYGRNFAPA